MEPVRAVVDTTFLIYWCNINQRYPIIELLPNLFERILVPQEVCLEFAAGSDKEPHRIPIMNDIETGDFLFEKCTQYDSFLVKDFLLLPKVDPGEAEALAQYLEVSASMLLSDDKPFSSTAKSTVPRLPIFNTVHIMAMLDINNFLTDYRKVVHAVHGVRLIREKSFPLYFNEAAKHLGFKISREDIADKTDFSRLGLK